MSKSSISLYLTVDWVICFGRFITMIFVSSIVCLFLDTQVNTCYYCIWITHVRQYGLCQVSEHSWYDKGFYYFFRVEIVTTLSNEIWLGGRLLSLTSSYYYKVSWRNLSSPLIVPSLLKVPVPGSVFGSLPSDHKIRRNGMIL